MTMIKKECAECGNPYKGMWNSCYCSAECRRVVHLRRAKASWASKGDVGEAYVRAKAQALRGKPGSGYARSKGTWSLSEAGFASIVGSCTYCGSDALGIVRKDLTAPWIPSNVKCACGICAKRKSGLSHSEFKSWIRTVSEHQTLEI